MSVASLKRDGCMMGHGYRWEYVQGVDKENTRANMRSDMALVLGIPPEQVQV